MSAPSEVIWFFCSPCGHETKHENLLEKSRVRSYGDERHTTTVVTKWDIFQCNGCEEITMQRWHGCSDDFDDGRFAFFPPQVSRRQPTWLSEWPINASYSNMLKEVYAALNADMPRLAMMGTRSIIEMITKGAVGEHRSFEAGLKQLKDLKRISELEHTIIRTAVNAGSAAVHRSYRPENRKSC